jgi:hypothetical protein
VVLHFDRTSLVGFSTLPTPIQIPALSSKTVSANLVLTASI